MTYFADLEFELRLVNTSEHGQGIGGLVEVFVDSVWGSICDDRWNDLTAAVVCRSLGLAFNRPVGVAKGAFGRSLGPIHLDDVYCNGDEDALDKCRFNTNPNCGHEEDAGVICV